MGQESSWFHISPEYRGEVSTRWEVPHLAGDKLCCLCLLWRGIQGFKRLARTTQIYVGVAGPVQTNREATYCDDLWYCKLKSKTSLYRCNKRAWSFPTYQANLIRLRGLQLRQLYRPYLLVLVPMKPKPDLLSVDSGEGVTFS